ncbi:MAG TPA: hypothetical protein VER12_05450 [Polyangiaceae bacterium]|nr:hypothetical protein [Polyangiaceae bacterium]
MLLRRVPSLALLACLSIVSVNCSSDNSGSTGGAGATSSAGQAGAVSVAGQANVAGSGAGSAPIAGSANASAGSAGSAPVAGSNSGGASGGTAGGSSAGTTSGGAGGASSAGAAGKAGAGSGGGSTSGAFTMTSAEIMEGMTIPDAHTCNGGGGTMNWGVAPSFKWTNPPAGTMSYAFFMIDWTLTMAASPSVNGYHSAAWNIPTTVTALAKGWSATDLGASAKVLNGGYLGPCPPTGTDTYHMIIMALPMASYTITGTGTAGVKTAYETLKAVALGSAEITGTAKKK